MFYKTRPENFDNICSYGKEDTRDFYYLTKTMNPDLLVSMYG